MTAITNMSPTINTIKMIPASRSKTGAWKGVILALREKKNKSSEGRHVNGTRTLIKAYLAYNSVFFEAGGG